MLMHSGTYSDGKGGVHGRAEQTARNCQKRGRGGGRFALIGQSEVQRLRLF
jgi:hypothetical protein